MAIGGWGTEPYGSRNYYCGECDTSLYFTVMVGIPVYFSFRGCIHLIEVSSGEKRKERFSRICQFMRDYFALSETDPKDAPGIMCFPLKPSRILKWMVLYYWLLWITAVAAFCAVADTAAILQTGRALSPGEDSFLIVVWIGFAFFVPGVVTYQIVRRPTRRQAMIRAAIAERLGPFSDPADWQVDLLTKVAAAYGSASPPADTVLQMADDHATSGKYVDALVLARLALGLLDWQDGNTRERAEAVTDEYLKQLEVSGAS